MSCSYGCEYSVSELASGGGVDALDPTLLIENQQYTDVSDLLYALKEAFVATGLFTLVYSSDGVANFGAADYWASSADVNDKAYIIIQEDSVLGRQWTFQRVGTGIRTKYSRTDKFITGATLINTPSATDGLLILGGGTDAAPSAAVLGVFANNYWYFTYENTRVNDTRYWLLQSILSGGAKQNLLGSFPVMDIGLSNFDPVIQLSYATSGSGAGIKETYWQDNGSGSVSLNLSFYATPASTTSGNVYMYNTMHSQGGFLKGPYVHLRRFNDSVIASIEGKLINSESGYWLGQIESASVYKMFLMSTSSFTVPGVAATLDGYEVSKAVYQ